MCLGNRAESSAHYINSQLRALYENARLCTAKHGNNLKPTSSVVEYSTCLFEYYGPGKHKGYNKGSKLDLAFYTGFSSAHRVEFVCNHEVILFLHLKDSHFTVDPSKPISKNNVQEKIDNFTVAFRVEFSTHSIEKFKCGEIGNAESYIINMHILDIESATLVPTLSTTHLTDAKLAALTTHLKSSYLTTLKRAGHHVLYSLPDFDNLSSTTAHIDYAVIARRALSVSSLFGIDIDDINRYLRSLWLADAAYVDEHGAKHDDKDSRSRHFLAEHKTVWTDEAEDVHIHMFSGPLRVQALCKREVVMYIDLQDVHFYIGGFFSDHAQHKFADWKIAFIVDVTYEEEGHGSIKRLKLNMGSARFCEHLSFFGAAAVELEVEIMTRLRHTLVRYISTYYLSILESEGHHCVFHHDKKIHGPICGLPSGPEFEPSDSGSDYGSDDDDDHRHGGHGGSGGGGRVRGEILGEGDCTCRFEGECGHIGTKGVRWGLLEEAFLTHTHCDAFDLVTSVTQGAINSSFRALWALARKRVSALGKGRHCWDTLELERETCVAEWGFVQRGEKGEEVFFEATFAPPKVQLLCAEGQHKVLVHFTLADGYLKTLGQGRSLRHGSEAYSFSNWRIAFEVDLKLVDAHEDSISEAVLKRHGRKGHQHFKQLILDFSTARLDLSSSHCPGLLDGDDYKFIRLRREALVHYFTHHYFSVFKRARAHVLYTIPLLDTTHGVGNHRHTLSSVKFQIVPFVYDAHGHFVQGLFGEQRACFERNMIVFLGMFDKHPMPAGWLPRGSGGNWVGGVGRDVPHGTVCLSYATFLRERILKQLEVVNRETTVHAELGAVEHGEWKPELTTWKKHARKMNNACAFVKDEKKCAAGQSLDFHWCNRDDWRYMHDGDFDGNGLYSVNCTTKNTVSVPTNRNSECIITIKGKVDLSLAYEGEGRKWSADMHTNWSAAIKFSSSAPGSGLQVHVLPNKIVPEFKISHVTGDIGHNTHEETFKRLREQFPHAINFSAIVSELKASFEGCWTGLYVDAREMVLGRPVFNRKGDLMLELGVKREVKEVTKKGGSSMGSVNGSNGTVSANGHHGEGWFRHAVHKAEDYVTRITTPTGSTPGTPLFSPTSTTSASVLSRTTSKSSVSSFSSVSSTTSVNTVTNGKGAANGHAKTVKGSQSNASLASSGGKTASGGAGAAGADALFVDPAVPTAPAKVA